MGRVKTKPAAKTRKILRKEKRQQKKLNRAAFYQKKNKNQEQSNIEQTSSTKAQKRQRPKDMKEKRIEVKAKKQRMEQLKQANQEEDKMIKQLEKRLKLNKRNSKSTPKSFVSDGLDYLLDFCDSENRSHLVETDKQLLETGLSTEFEEDLNIAIGAENDVEDESEKFEGENNKDNDKDSEQDMNMENLSTDENSDQDDNEDIAPEETHDINIETEEYLSDKDEAEDEESRHITVEQSDDNEGLWEDIYGRQRDKKGNIVSKKYVPPGARITSTDISLSGEKVHRLERQLKGILNRLAEQNMHTIGNQVEEMYMSNSRNNMNVILSKLMIESIVAPVLTPDRLICEHMMLITILHANIGTEVGAHFSLTIVRKFHQILEESHCVENKELDNLILIISHLYNFKV